MQLNVKKRGSLFALAGLGLAALAGCNEVTVETVETGQTLCYSDFEACIDPIFHGQITQRTCSASGCHSVYSGSGGAFKIYPDPAPGSAEMLANFFAAKAFANLTNPPQSKLLLEPLQGISSVTGTHAGGDIFPNTSDACYGAMLQWISNRVDDAEGAGCGGCAAVNVAGCGF